MLDFGQAAEAAQAAARRVDVEIAELRTRADLHAAAELFAGVWGSAATAPVSPDILRAFVHTGNYVAGAKSSDALVGASVGFLARSGSSLTLHSHITGVSAETQLRGIGYALKLHQRAWAIEHGLSAITWTYDPLVRRNAYFNLTKLGARADRFHVNFYGAMADRINAGDESDRCAVTWDLTPLLGDAHPEPDVDALLASGAVALLEDDGEGAPRTRSRRGDVRLCWIPADIVELRASAPDVARAWRLALRATLGASIDEGYVATAMTTTGWYVLERDGGRE